MINRLKRSFDQPDEPAPASDYHVIVAGGEVFYVTQEVAAEVIEKVKRTWPPRWISFVNLSGSTVRVRSRLIECVKECTGSQRAAAREFRRARRQEDKANRRPWEDDDDWW